jgi:hypothetical protein
MVSYGLLRGALIAALAIPVISACSAAGSVSARLQSRPVDISKTTSWISPSALSHDLFYVVQNARSAVLICRPPDMTYVGVLQVNFPLGVAVDKQRNLYVTHWRTNLINEVLVFHPGAVNPFKTLSDSAGYIGNITVGQDGTVYVANSNSLTFGPGNVLEYAHGSTTPTTEIDDPNFQTVSGVALDSKNNLYVAFKGSGGGSSKRISPGKHSGRDTRLFCQ